MVEDASFDIVISGQSLEHTEFFWLVFEEFKKEFLNTKVLYVASPPLLVLSINTPLIVGDFSRMVLGHYANLLSSMF